MELTIEKLLEIADEIPENKWIAGTFGAFNDNGCRCFVGHVTEKLYPPATGDHCVHILRKINGEIIGNLSLYGITTINDSNSDDYSQPTPKERIKAFLTDCLTKSKQ